MTLLPQPPKVLGPPAKATSFSLVYFLTRNVGLCHYALNSKERLLFWDIIYVYSKTYHNINLHLANFTWLKVGAKPLKIFALTVQNSVLTYIAHLIPKKRIMQQASSMEQLSRQTQHQGPCT